MKRHILTCLGMLVCASFVTACSGIRVVEMSSDGGEIALLGDREDALETARKEMAATCGGPNNYEIVRQGEVVVGEVTTVRQRTRRVGRRRNRGTVTRQQAVTQAKREWRVYYDCLGADDSTAQSSHQLTFSF